MDRIEGQPWWAGTASRDAIEDKLMEGKQGDFVVRQSTKDGSYVLCVLHGREVRHFKVNKQDGVYFLNEDQQFPTLELLVNTAMTSNVGLGDVRLIRPAAKQEDPMYPTHDPMYTQDDGMYPTQDPMYPTQDPMYPMQDPMYPAQDPVYPPQSAANPHLHMNPVFNNRAPVFEESSSDKDDLQANGIAISRLKSGTKKLAWTPGSTSTSAVPSRAGSERSIASTNEMTIRNVVFEQPKEMPYLDGENYPKREEYSSKKRVEVEIPGAISDHRKAFANELIPGEIIVGEFEVNLIQEYKRGCMLALAYCLFCYKKIHANRGRLVVTNKRRVMMWTLNTDGSQLCCDSFCLSSVYKSHTGIHHFSVDDIALMQFQHHRKSRVMCMFPLCFLPECWTVPGWHSSLRLFFRNYPNSSQLSFLQRISGGGSVASTVTPTGPIDLEQLRNWFRYKTLSLDCLVSCCVSLASLCNCICVACTSVTDVFWRLFSATPQNSIIITSVKPELRCCELDCLCDPCTDKHYDEFDFYHRNNKTAYDELTRLQQTVAGLMPVCIPTAPSKEAPVHNPSSSYQLVADGKVQINPQLTTLGAGEEILDACPRDSRVTPGEAFTLILLCFLGGFPGLIYWICVLKPRYRRKFATVITNKRVLALTMEGRYGDESKTASFLYQADSYGLNGLSSYVVYRDRAKVTAQAQTNYGTLLIDPQVRDKWSRMYYHGLSEASARRACMFLSKLSMSRRLKCIDKNQIPPSPVNNMVVRCKEILALSPLAEAEEPLTYFESRPAYVGNCCPGVSMTRICTMGIRPVKLISHVVVTTHRIVARVIPENSPCMCDGCFGVHNQVLVSIPLHSVDMNGWGLDGFTNVQDNCYRRACICCCSKASSRMQISIGLNGGFPIELEDTSGCCCTKSDGYGRMELPDVRYLQQIIGAGVAGRNARFQDGWRI